MRAVICSMLVLSAACAGTAPAGGQARAPLGTEPVSGAPIGAAPTSDAAPGKPPAVAPAAPTEHQLELCRMMLRSLHRGHLSSSLRIGAGEQQSAAARLRAARPIDALDRLQRNGDPAVSALGGVFYGLLVRDLDAVARLAPGLVDCLHDGDARVRAFAAEALGELGWRDAVPHLEPLLGDRAPVPGYTAGTTVATFARHALDKIARRSRSSDR